MRKGDIVKIMRGKYKGKEGKVVNVDVKKTYVNVENLSFKKKDGKEVLVKFHPSNLLIVELFFLHYLQV